MRCDGPGRGLARAGVGHLERRHADHFADGQLLERRKRRLGFIVGGTLIMEMVFSYPGIGFLLYNATTNHDYTLMQGCFLVITLSVLVANIVADFVYAALDPRTRQEG